VRVIAYTIETHDDDQLTIRESTGQSITSADIGELLDWLLIDYTETPEILMVTWDLADFAAPLLRKLGPECCEELAKNQPPRTKLFPPYNIFYRYVQERGGLFAIDKGFKKQTASFYSLNQFFPKGQEAPETAEAVQSLGDDLIQSLSSIGVNPTKLTSPIAAYLSCTTLPIPRSDRSGQGEILAGEYAFECTSREWRDCFQVGTWEADQCFDYDLINAYSAVAAQLLDTRDAEFIYSTDYVPGAYWGFLKGRVTIKGDVLVSPIIREMADGSHGTPVGSWDTYLTLGEVNFINKNEIGHFDLEDGWFVKFRHGDRPLESLMRKLYGDRKKSDNPTLARFLKDTANGMIGKLLQVNDDGTVGEYYNPVWHAMVTSTVRLAVSRFIYNENAQEHVIAINTDGCLMDREMPVRENPGLGQWRLSGTHPAIAVSPGLVFTADKSPQGINYDTLRAMMAEDPKASEYRHYRRRHTTLKEAVDAGDIGQVGELNTYSGTVNLPAIAESLTRQFLKYPQNGGELLAKKYVSTPFRWDSLTTSKP